MTLEHSYNVIYAKQFRIGHNADEFILECCEASDAAAGSMGQRVVFSPSLAQELHTLLGNSLREHSRLIAALARRKH